MTAEIRIQMTSVIRAEARGAAVGVRQGVGDVSHDLTHPVAVGVCGMDLRRDGLLGGEGRAGGHVDGGHREREAAVVAARVLGGLQGDGDVDPVAEVGRVLGLELEVRLRHGDGHVLYVGVRDAHVYGVRAVVVDAYADVPGLVGLHLDAAADEPCDVAGRVGIGRVGEGDESYQE